MRRIFINTGTVRDGAVATALREIEKASADENIVDIAQAFTIEGDYTETRTLNVETATLEETKAFIATLIADLQRGGQNRTT